MTAVETVQKLADAMDEAARSGGFTAAAQAAREAGEALRAVLAEPERLRGLMEFDQDYAVNREVVQALRKEADESRAREARLREATTAMVSAIQDIRDEMAGRCARDEVHDHRTLREFESLVKKLPCKCIRTVGGCVVGEGCPCACHEVASGESREPAKTSEPVNRCTHPEGEECPACEECAHGAWKNGMCAFCGEPASAGPAEEPGRETR